MFRCFFVLAIIIVKSFGQNEHENSCNNEGKPSSDGGVNLTGVKCCRNHEGKYLVAQETLNQSCCHGSETPVYNTEKHFCNISRLIERNSDDFECEYLDFKQVFPRNQYELCDKTIAMKMKQSSDEQARSPITTKFSTRNVDVERSQTSGEQERLQIPATVKPSTDPLQDEDNSCNPFDGNCCNGELLTQDYLCSHNRQIQKRHPNHNRVCDGKTFNNKKMVCYNGKIKKGPICSKKNQGRPRNGHVCCGNEISSYQSSFVCCQNVYMDFEICGR